MSVISLHSSVYVPSTDVYCVLVLERHQKKLVTITRITHDMQLVSEWKFSEQSNKYAQIILYDP